VGATIVDSIEQNSTATDQTNLTASNTEVTITFINYYEINSTVASYFDISVTNGNTDVLVSDTTFITSDENLNSGVSGVFCLNLLSS